MAGDGGGDDDDNDGVTRGHTGGHDGAGGYLAQYSTTPPDDANELGGRGGDGGDNLPIDLQRGDQVNATGVQPNAGSDDAAPRKNNHPAAPGTGTGDHADAAVGEKRGRSQDSAGTARAPPPLPASWRRFSECCVKGGWDEE